MFLEACTQKCLLCMQEQDLCSLKAQFLKQQLLNALWVNNQPNLCFSCTLRFPFTHLSPFFSISSSPKLYSIKREEMVYVSVSLNLMGARFPFVIVILKPNQLV